MMQILKGDAKQFFKKYKLKIKLTQDPIDLLRFVPVWILVESIQSVNKAESVLSKHIFLLVLLERK